MQLDARVFSAVKAPFARRRVAKYVRVAVRVACDLADDAPPCDLSAARDGSERVDEARRERLGLPRYLAERSRRRLLGPLFPFCDSAGAVLAEDSNLHPLGPKRRTFAPDGGTDSELEGCCNASRYAPCLASCGLCRGSFLE